MDVNFFCFAAYVACGIDIDYCVDDDADYDAAYVVARTTAAKTDRAMKLYLNQVKKRRKNYKFGKEHTANVKYLKAYTMYNLKEKGVTREDRWWF